MTIEPGWYRENGPQISAVGGGIIKDRGFLAPAKPFERTYLFKDTETGAKPLVLLGNREAIFKELDYWDDGLDTRVAESGIRNTIKDNPRIYMDIYPYTTQPRWEGLFPVQAAVNALVSGVLSAAGAGVDAHFASDVSQMLKDVAGGAGDLKDWATQMKSFYSKVKYVPKDVINLAIKNNKEAKEKGILYIRFRYLPDDNKWAEHGCIGSRFVSFGTISKLLEVALNGRPPMPAKMMKKDT